MEFHKKPVAENHHVCALSEGKKDNTDLRTARPNYMHFFFPRYVFGTLKHRSIEKTQDEGGCTGFGNTKKIGLGCNNTIATMMLNRWRSTGFEDGTRPEGYAMSRHDSSCGSKNQFHAMYLWQSA
jgi:hypothetical protein